MHKDSHQRGFTLIELVMVIVILGVIGGMVAVFMRGPIDAYVDSRRRAALTDVADTTVRRIARDLRKALPNSVRILNAQCLEFIPTKTGGRYRAEEIVAADNTSLNFALADSTFNMLGSNAALPSDQRIVGGDVVVVYNLGIPGSNAYLGNNTAVVTATQTETGSPLETPINLPVLSAVRFPLASGNNRFHVVPGAEQVVGYVCDGGNLRRYVRTLPYPAPATCPTPATSDPILARNVSACSFNYTGSDLQRNALVSMAIQLTDGGETISLQHQVHVNNTP